MTPIVKCAGAETVRRILILNFHRHARSLIDELVLELEFMQRSRLVLYLVDADGAGDLGTTGAVDPRIEIENIECDSHDDEFINRLDLASIDTAVILSDRTKKRDPALFTILQAKRLALINPELHIIVELQSSRNIVHLGQTNVADVVCIEELSEKILSNSAITHGFSKFYMHLLYNKTDTNSIFSIDIPACIVGMRYCDVEALVCDYEEDLILLGYITVSPFDGRGNYIVINPDRAKPDTPDGKDYRFKANDRLLLLGYNNPNQCEFARFIEQTRIAA